MAKVRAYRFNPSHLIYLSSYLTYGSLLILSLYMVISQDIVDIVVLNQYNTFISMQELDAISFGSFKLLISYLFMIFSLLLIMHIGTLFLIIRGTLYTVIPSRGIIRIKKGIFSKQVDVIKIENILDIDSSISVMERLLGLGTITMYTSGDMSAISDKISGEERRRLAEINSNVVRGYVSIRKMVSIKKADFIRNTILKAQQKRR